MILKVTQLIVFFVGILTFAQFNTITPITIEKQNFFEKESMPQRQKFSIKKEKKPWLNILKSPTKNQLKKEVDSLKLILNQKNENAGASHKINFKKIEDSLVEIINKRILSKEKIQNMDFPTTSKISMPLKNTLKVTSDFGIRFHPFYKSSKPHNGVDLRANYEYVYAVLDGIVTESGYDENGGGNYLKILHSNRFETSYLHLSKIYYQKGEFVKAGFIIAKSGNTGNSTAPHLHFAVKEFGKYIHPISFLNDLKLTQQLIQKKYGNTFANR